MKNNIKENRLGTEPILPLLIKLSIPSIVSMTIQALYNVVFMPVFGLNQGFMPIVGYNYGHNNPKRMKEAIKYGILTGFVFTTFGFIIFQLIPNSLINLFNSDPQLIEVGVRALRTISFSFPMAGIIIVGSTSFQAIGRGFISMAISFLRQLIVLLPLAYIFSKISGLETVWFAFPISEIIAFILFIVLFKKIFSNVYSEMGSNS